MFLICSIIYNKWFGFYIHEDMHVKFKGVCTHTHTHTYTYHRMILSLKNIKEYFLAHEKDCINIYSKVLYFQDMGYQYWHKNENFENLGNVWRCFI